MSKTRLLTLLFAKNKLKMVSVFWKVGEINNS